MKVVMVTGESNPLVKTGGLADVVYSLSKELVKSRKNDVSIIMPFYKQVKAKLTKRPVKVCSFEVYMSWRKQYCVVYKTLIDGIRYFLIKNDQYFGRDNIYSYDDDIERFACFTLASKKLMEMINLIPDVIHIHDWHPGMLPLLIKDDYGSPLNKAKFVLTIHNPAFKGLFDKYFLGNFYNLNDKYFNDGSVCFNGAVSTLKTAIMYSNKITTVSPTHRIELLTDESISGGLNHVLEYRRDDFVGILNGIDYEEFDPTKDEKIIAKLKGNVASFKKANKEALLKEKDLVNDDAPLYGMVSRLTWQKGLDIMLGNVESLLQRGNKVIILGSGESKYENHLEYLRAKYPHHLSIYIGYNDELAHKIYAASDFFLMPSLFEPCGLSQMISLHYATLPVVRLVGGLKDSVTPYVDDNLKYADGFGFYDYTYNALSGTLNWCEQVYKDKEKMKILRNNALEQNYDWKKSSQKYLALYKSII